MCFQFTDKDGEELRVRLANDIESHYNDFITVSEPDARAYDDALPERPIPGTGELGDDCGDMIPGLGCPYCATSYEVGRTCRRSRCPRCWNAWALHGGAGKVAKLQGLAKVEGAGGRPVFKHHLVASLRDSTRFNSQDPERRAIEAIKLLLPKLNVFTGYIIFHPWRIKEEYRGSVLGHESGEGDMTWKDILAKVESEAWSWEAVKEEFLVYSPHFHIICLSPTVEKSAVSGIEEQTGIVFHRIEQRRDDGKIKSIADLEELSKVMAYSLSHAALAPENDGETYRAVAHPFGKVANFEADDRTEAEAKAAMRQVAPQVLGIETPDPTCSSHIHSSDQSGSGSESGADTGLPRAARTLSESGGPASSGGSPSASAETWGAANDAALNDNRVTWDATAGIIPTGIDHAPAGEGSKCDGKLVPMWVMETKLSDLEWINAIEERFNDGEERLIELRKDLERWDDLGRPRPDIPPDD